MSKLRSDSALAQLTDGQRDQLFDWLKRHSYSEVIALAAKPESETGLNIRFHRNTLIRFHESEAAERRRLHLAEVAATSISLSTDSGMSAEFKQDMIAAKARYGEATYNLSKAADDPENYDRLQPAIQHFDLCAIKCRQLDQEHQRIELARQRLAEEIRQFEFCAAREVMKAYVACQEIDKRTDIDEIDKIWEARKKLFGAEAVAAIDRQARQFQERLAASKNAAGSAPAPGAPFGAPLNVPTTSSQSTQIHAALKNPLPVLHSFSEGGGPPVSRPASNPAPSVSELGTPCPPQPLAKEDPSSIASAKEEALSPLRAAAVSTPQLPALNPQSPHTPDTLVNTSSHSSRHSPPSAPENAAGTAPAPGAPPNVSPTPEKSTQIHALPENPPGSAPASGATFGAPPNVLRTSEKSTQMHATPENPPLPSISAFPPSVSQHRTQDPGLRTERSAQIDAPAEKARIHARSAFTPAMWLQVAQHPERIRAYLQKEFCGNSPERLAEYLKSTAPTQIGEYTLRRLGEIP